MSEPPFRYRLAGFLLISTLAIVSCGRPTETPSAAGGTAAPEPRVVEGAPQIVDSIDGVHIEYHVYGSGEPAVVLVHGWSCDANYWREQIAALKPHFTTVTVNLAGHGASGRNRTEWSMGRYGEDVAAVVRQLRERQVVLVGHAMGGTVALEAARRIGDRVIGIIGVDTFKSIGQPPWSAAEVDLRLKPFREDFIGRTRDLVTSALFTADADPVFVRQIADDMALQPPEVAVASMQELLRLDLAPVLADVQVPIVAINADLTPTDETRIRKVLPDFRAVVLEHTGHFLMMEAPDRFNPALLREIRALAGSGGG